MYVCEFFVRITRGIEICSYIFCYILRLLFYYYYYYLVKNDRYIAKETSLGHHLDNYKSPPIKELKVSLVE